MSEIEIRQLVPQREFMQHAEELLCHTSRYYIYTEKFLADLVEDPSFCMAGYDCDQLSPDQRSLLAALVMESPTKEIGKAIVQVVSDVIAGRKEVDEVLEAKYREHLPSRRYLLHHYCGGHGFQLNNRISPAEAIQDLAKRLLIPIEVKGQVIRLPFSLLGQYLDSANPVIRQNIEESVQLLYEGGYRLSNMPVNSDERLDWGWNRIRMSLRLFIWYLRHFRRPHQHPMKSRMVGH